MQKGSLFSTSLTTFFFLFDNSEPTRCNAISHCGFDAWQCQAPMHAPVNQLYFFLEKVIFRSPAIFGSFAHIFREGDGITLQNSCLENPMDGGAWWAAIHGVARSGFTFTFHFHALEKEMATHSSILAWRIPGAGELGGLPSMGSYRVRHD